ncbi:MAG TPA: NYN domain-containing protein [Lachnospiraceae bacterium]|nr:NYN domain-containing protein [Lachnospiraceae bacterium]
METDKKFALLIDADNISPKYIDIILTETVNYGIASVRRIYGDWTDISKHSWKECLLRNSLTPIQQYSYTFGKNASDSAMIIDAMDILYGNHVDGFIIATSDSDFTTLARRLREDGKMVIGMGESKTPMAFVKACEQFKTLDVLYESEKQAEERAEVEEKARNKAEKRDKKNMDQQTAEDQPSVKKAGEQKQEEAVPITSLKTMRKSIMNIIDEQTEDGEWMNLGELGNILQKRYPDFDCRVYRFSKFSKMIESFQGIELSKQGDNLVLVRKQVIEQAPPKPAKKKASPRANTVKNGLAKVKPAEKEAKN